MKRTAILIAALLALVPAVAPAAFPGRNGAIVYSSYSDDWVGDAEGGGYSLDHWRIELRTTSGSKRVFIRCDETESTSCRDRRYQMPAISPDGRRVAFTTGTSVVLTDLDGANLSTFAGPRDPVRSVGFSPDGTQLVVAAGRGIWIVALADGVARRLTDGFFATWSRRNWIAFVRHNVIYRVHPDGTGLRRLATNARVPEWSPDGRRLAFARIRGLHGSWDTAPGVYTMNADGQNTSRLGGVLKRLAPYELAWSPDGHRLAVASLDRLVTTDLRGESAHVERTLMGDDAWISGVAWQPLPR